MVLLFFFNQSIGQNCDIKLGLIKIEELNIIGSFSEANTIIEELLKCDFITNNKQAQLWIWSYQLNRDSRKSKKAQASLLKAESLIKEPNLDFKLLLAESYSLIDDIHHSENILQNIEQDVFNSSRSNSNLKSRYYLINYFNLVSQGYLEKCIQNLQLALAETENQQNIPIYYTANIYKGLGRMYRTNGDFDKSLIFFEKELQILKSHYPPDHITVSISQYHIGNVYYEKLEYQNALDYYLKAHKVWVKSYAQDYVYMRYINEAIGDMYWELGDQENALLYFNLSVLNEQKMNNDDSEQYIIIGDSLVQKGNYQFALNYYESALRFREKTYGKNHILTGACKNFVARAKRSSGNIKGSLDEYQDAINILVEEMTSPSWYENPTKDMKIQSHQYLLESLIAKGELLKELHLKTKETKDLIASLNTFETAIDILEDMKNNEMSESSMVFWTQRTLMLIENSIESAFLLYQITNEEMYLHKAFNFSERSKALLLLSTLSDHNLNSFANVSEEIILKEKDLKNKINEYQGKIKSEEKRCDAIRGKMLDLWQNKLTSLQNDFDLLISEIKEKYPDYYHLKFDIQIANLALIQEQLLDNNTALISYFTGKKNSYVFLITQSNITLRSIEESSELFIKTIDFFNTIRSNKKVQINPQKAFEEYKTIAFQLYKKLLLPELSTLNKQKLIIIPDGKLSYLPFDILLSKEVINNQRNYKSLPYLLKDYAISYSPSASISILAKKDENASNKYLGFAPDYKGEFYSESNKKLANLFYNEKEITFASNIFDGKSWIGNNVTEELLKNNSSEAGILHLAMHGEVEDEHPLLSKLYFNTSEKEDGMLHIYEIYNLNIPAQIVILSACNTASGKLQRGEGIMSLERAFQYAGSKSLLSTLWTVDDESSFKINQLFLEKLKAGKPKDIALQEAKLSFLNTTSPEKLHPYYWSSFRLTGNTSPLKTTSKSICFIIGISILAFIAVVYFRRKLLKKAS
ncbi:MAG: hypothetical protein COB12_09790 [Flavobacterium sp.]|nr:MAG: hypothetical protein COB12_09790 [Flavobacterium sp.]